MPPYQPNQSSDTPSGHFEGLPGQASPQSSARTQGQYPPRGLHGVPLEGRPGDMRSAQRAWANQSQRRSGGGRGVWTVLSIVIIVILTGGLGLSLLANVGLAAVVAGGAGTAGLQERPLSSSQPLTGSRVVVLPLEGVVDGQMAGFAEKAFNHLDENPPEALVVRVDSPGGSPSASDEIWRRIEKFQTNHPAVPVVASFGAIAASGGYYLSTGVDEIFAEEITITGSIGVIAQAFTLEGTLDKLGIAPEVLVADGSPEKDVANNSFRHWGEQDRLRMKRMLNMYYDQFVNRVVQGRGSRIASNQVSNVCNGDIYTAKEALGNGLIDQVGYLEDAIAYAAQQAGVGTQYRAVQLQLPPSFLEQLSGDVQVLPHGANADWSAEGIRGTAQSLATPRIMYWAPISVGAPLGP